MQTLTADKRQVRSSFALFMACTVFFFAIMLCVPLSSDDFEWSTESFDSFGDVLDHCLAYGNGRLLGNLNMMLLARNPLLSATVKALMISGLIFMLPTLLGLKNTWAYLASFLLFVSVRPGMFGQVYTWTSGFGNYIPPVWLGLALLLLVRRFEELKNRGAKLAFCCAIFLMSFAGQLYVEHASVVSLLMAVSALVYCRRKTEYTAPLLCWLAGAILGLALMFLIPRLFALPGNRAEGYRGMINGGIMIWIEGMIRGFASAVSSFPPVGSILVAAFTLLTLHITKGRRSRTAESIILVLSLLSLSYLLFNEFVLANRWQGRMIVIKNFVTAGFAVLPLLLWAWALLPLEDKSLRNRLWALLALSLISLAPFVFVYPAPERVAFLSYVFAAAAILLFSARLFEKSSPERGKSWVTALICASLASVLALGMTFVNILWLSDIREQHIAREMAKGAEEITIFQIPHGYVFWDGPLLFGRGYYYEQWHDITFSETTFDDWYANHWMK